MANVKLHSDIGVIRTFKVIENKHHFAIGEFVDNSIQSFIDYEDQLRTNIKITNQLSNCL